MNNSKQQELVAGEKPHELEFLEGVTRCGKGWKALCPAHEDLKASLSVGIGDGGMVLLHCFAGCTYPEILNGIRQRQNEPRKVISLARARIRHRKERNALDAPATPISLESLAQSKGLPVNFLTEKCGLARAAFNQGVTIPYRDLNGQLIAVKHRFAMRAKDGSRWPRGVALALYGL